MVLILDFENSANPFLERIWMEMERTTRPDKDLQLRQKSVALKPAQRGAPMIQFDEQYLVDEEGNRKAVVLPISAWEQILEVLEEFDDIRAYDQAKNHPSERIPFEQAVSEISKGTHD